jgi:transcription elongation factor GreA
MLNRKLYLHKIKQLKQKINDISLLLEQELKTSNEEEQSVRIELLNKQNIYQLQIQNILSLLSTKADSSLLIGHKYLLDVNGQSREVMIVAPDEADPTKNMISTNSPLGKALENKNQGDTVLCETPAGQVSYKIQSKSALLG